MSIGIGIGLNRVQAVVPDGVLVLDTFTDENGVSLSDHVADTGQSWTMLGTAAYAISSNRLRSVARPSNARAVIESGAADGLVQVTIVQAGLEGGLVFRYLDENNYWTLSGGTSGGGNAVRLRKIASGVATIVFSGANVGNGTILGVELDGSAINVYQNGALVHTASDSHGLAATLHGVCDTAWADIWTTLDDFRVTAQ